MSLNASRVRVGIAGELYKAPFGTTAPTDATSALDSAFSGLGYVSEDGVTENWDDSVDDIVAWQNATTVRSSTTQSTLSFGLTLIETSGLVLEAFHRGSSITADGGGDFHIDVKPITADPSAWVLQVVDGTKLIRIHVGNGEIVERGEVMYANGEPVGYPITLRAYPDGAGNLCTKFSNDVAWGYY